MTPKQIQDLEPAFANNLLQFFDCCAYPQTFHLLEVYCRGRLSDLPRKSTEPIALAAGWNKQQSGGRVRRECRIGLSKAA